MGSESTLKSGDMTPRKHVDVVDDTMAEILAAKSGAERLKIAFGMHRTARKLLTASVRASKPQLNEKQVRQEVARRLLRGTK
jgi:hypothetical protein